MAQSTATRTLTEIQRGALTRLVDVVRRTSSREKSLIAARDDSTRGADQTLASGRRTIQTRHEQERSRAEQSGAAALARIEGDSSDAISALEREWRSSLDDIEQRAERRRTDAEKARREAIWLADTVFEATGNQPHENFEQSRKGLRGFAQELEAVEANASQWLRACRQPPAPVPSPPADEQASEEDRRAAETAGSLPSKHRLESTTDEARQHLAAMRSTFLPRLFRSGLPIILPLIPAAGAASLAAWREEWVFGGRSAAFVWGACAGGLLLGLLLLLILYYAARRSLHRDHAPLLEAVASARRAMERCAVEAAGLRDLQVAALRERRDREIRHAEEVHGPMLERIAEARVKRLDEVQAKYPAQLAAAKTRREIDLASAVRQREQELVDADRRRDEALVAADQTHTAATADARALFTREWAELVATWQRETREALADLEDVQRAIQARFPAWKAAQWIEWTPPRDFPSAIPFGTVRVDLSALEGGLPLSPELALSAPTSFDLPALLNFPEAASILVQSAGAGLDSAVPLLQSVMFRLLTALPPGKVRFTILDPVSLGQNFAGFMHLADDDGALVTDRIWTEDRHIDQRLLDITEHMENVIQKYLRNEYQTIGQYNVDAGEIAEPYRYLVAANLPVNFSESASRRLMSVAASGPRCGVFTLITADVRAPRPPGLQIDDLARSATPLRFDAAQSRFIWDDEAYAFWPLSLETAPPEALVTRILKIVGREAKHSSRVEVPFGIIAPPGEPPLLRGARGDAKHAMPNGAARQAAESAAASLWWSRRSGNELRVALGRAGATKLQELTLGVGVAQHVLIAGKTGSGKSTLLHALITNLAMWYAPDEVEFYLVDFKKGVEFKTYAVNELPHARAVAIESDREFGLSVLQRLDAELRRRGELYRDLGVQDLAGYRKAIAEQGAGESLPRTLLVIDEFQEFFTEDDKIGQDATLLLDRLVRQGRAFGIHVILGSQTLGGAYSLARATIGQMAVRIALQCSESDSYLILSDDNAAARLLSRPGEAIYNDQGGLVEGNNPFQIAWLNDDQRDAYLSDVRELAQQRDVRRAEPMIVFEGNVPAELSRHPLLALLAEGRPPRAARVANAPALGWLGDAIAIKDPTAAVFRRQSGANMLVVGQRDEAAIGMLFASALGLVAQRADSKVYLFDGLPPDSPEAGRLASLADVLPGAVRSVPWREVPEAIAEISAELERRQSETGPDAPPIFLVVAGLQRYRMLRQEEEFGFTGGDADAPAKPDKQFGLILREGPLFGVHTLAWVDTYNNLARSLDRQAMKEFEQRVLFQMSQADSSTLIDSPAAARLGLHRAIYFSDEAGTIEKFRPYAMPERDWLERVAAQVRSGAGAAQA